MPLGSMVSSVTVGSTHIVQGRGGCIDGECGLALPTCQLQKHHATCLLARCNEQLAHVNGTLSHVAEIGQGLDQRVLPSDEKVLQIRKVLNDFASYRQASWPRPEVVPTVALKGRSSRRLATKKDCAQHVHRTNR